MRQVEIREGARRQHLFSVEEIMRAIVDPLPGPYLFGSYFT